MTASAPVLVVDNRPDKLLAIRATLAPLGCRIVEADSGIAALRCLMEEDFAVILLDVRMPGMNGFETASLIRLRQRSEITPIIFITAHAADEMVTERYAQGAVDFLFTPFDPDEIRAKVSAFANLFMRAETLAAQAREVQATADQLRLLTDAAPIGIFQTDAQNRYTYSNPRWAEITGISSAEAEGKQWDCIVSPDQRAVLTAELTDVPVDGAELSHRFEIAGPEGTSRIVLFTSRSIQGEDGVLTGWVGTLADITSEVGAEAAMSVARDRATEASRMKSDFLANMSHEIRTPMNGVLGMTELLLDTDLDPVQHDYAQTVHTSGQALLTVINDILDFSKIETGNLEVEELNFAVRTITGDVVDLLTGSARGSGLTLTAIVDDSVPETVSGDPGRLRQVLMNLIGNAIKFSDTGEIVVRASASDEPQAGLLIRFEVSDTGIGIAPEKLAVIFEPFMQEDTSTSRRYGGTGLGLAISSQLVALMDGKIGVSSTVGVGSTFWFTIRGSKAHDEPSLGAGHDDDGVDPGSPGGVSDSGVGAPAALRHGRLLLVEDNPVNQKVALIMLTRAGYDVDTAADGLEAVQATVKQGYDAILMDCQMPRLNGYEATAAIREREGSARHTPIIALTAGARREDEERSLAQGMDLYLSKPFTQESLVKVVQEAMRQGRARESATGQEPAPPPQRERSELVGPTPSEA